MYHLWSCISNMSTRYQTYVQQRIVQGENMVEFLQFLLLGSVCAVFERKSVWTWSFSTWLGARRCGGQYGALRECSGTVRSSAERIFLGVKSLGAQPP